MNNNSTLDFLDEEAAPQENVLDFLKEPEEDILGFLNEPKKRKHIIEYYLPEEKTPEELKAMSIEERMEYSQKLQNVRDLQSGPGLVKGLLSGATLGVSEEIPGLKPEEEDLMVGFGEMIGTTLPASALYKFIGGPLVKAASKSPYMRQGLEAFARLTGMGVTGAVIKTEKDILKGKMPDPEEVAKEGALWAGIDAALQTFGFGLSFGQAVRNIAAQDNIPAKEVLNRLWQATKHKLKRPVHPDEIQPKDINKLMETAHEAETGGIDSIMEVEPKEAEGKVAKPEEVKLEEVKVEEAKPEVKPEEVAKPEEAVPEEKPKEKVSKTDKLKLLEEKQKNLDALIDKYESEGGDYLTTAIKDLPQEIQSGMKDLEELNIELLNTEVDEIKNILPEIYSEDEKNDIIKVLGISKYSRNYEVINDLKNDLVNDKRKKTILENLALKILPGDIKKTVDSLDEIAQYYPEYVKESVDILDKIIEHFGLKQKPAEPKPKEIASVEKPEEPELPGHYHRTNDFTLYIDSKGEPAYLVPAFSKEKLTKNEKNLLKQAHDNRYSNPKLSEQQFNDVVNSVKKRISELKTEEPKKPKKPKKPKAEKPVEIEKVPVQEIKGQDISKEGLKSQKQYILNEIENALQQPTESEFVVIDVPDGGKFKVRNNPDSLQKLKKDVEKNWPDKPYKPKKQKVPEVKEKFEIKEEVGEKGEKRLVLASKKPKAEKPSKAKKPGKPKEKHKPAPGTEPKRPVIGKKQAVARSKIIDLFRKAFKDPIRLGKFKQRALGIHKLWPKVTRLLKSNDVETAAHEIGHNLHMTLYGGDATIAKQQAANVTTALNPYLGELKPLAKYEPFGMEGFAEFTRLYVTNPEVAMKLAPKFYAKFEADVEAQYPEMLNALLEAREYYDTYLQGTPQSRVRAQTSYASDKGKLVNLIESIKKHNFDYIKTQFLDDVFPAKRVVAELFGIKTTEVENLKDPRNLYRALRVLKGAVGKGDVFLLFQTFNTKLEKVNGSLRDILKKLPDEEAYREFNDYLIARRAVEKAGQGIETGIEPGDALIVQRELRAKYRDLAEELDKYNDTLLQYARDAGMLSPMQYQSIKDNNLMYVPFQRVMEKEQRGVISGGGKIQAGKVIKRMKGSTRDIIAPIESVIKNTYSILLNAEKNLAGQVLGELSRMKNAGMYIEKVPIPTTLKAKVTKEETIRSVVKHLQENGLDEFLDETGKGLREDIEDLLPDVIMKFGPTTYPAGENIVTVYYGGKPTYYEVTPELHEMWQKGTSPYVSNLLIKLLRIPARTLRAGAILNPRFIQKNVIRDTWESWLFTKYGKTIKDPAGLFIDTLYSPLAMIAEAANKGPLYVEWMKSGGGLATMTSMDRNSVIKKLDEVRGKVSLNPLDWLRVLGGISEEANRLAEFGRAIQVEGDTRLGKEIAAFAARDISIDYAKMGMLTKALNQLIPFFNATLQGGDKLLRTLANPKDRAAFFVRALGYIAIPSLMLAWLNKDDENIQEFQEQEKDFNFIAKVGNTYIKIPVPFEAGVIFHGMTQRMFNYFMKKDPEAFEGFFGSIYDASMPNFTPSFAYPIFEVMANKKFFTGGRIIPMAKEHLVSRYQYNNYTSATSRLLGRAMNYMLGEDTRSKAASPAIIEHFINSWTGGLGRLVVQISDAGLEAAGMGDKIVKPHQTITERFGLEGFTARFPRANTRSIEKFYDNYQDATARQKSIAHAEKLELEPEEDIKKAKERFDKIYDYHDLKVAYKDVQNCQRAINNIWLNPDIEPEVKRQMIDQLYLEMIAFCRAANEDVKKYRLSQKDND